MTVGRQEKPKRGLAGEIRSSRTLVIVMFKCGVLIDNFNRCFRSASIPPLNLVFLFIHFFFFKFTFDIIAGY